MPTSRVSATALFRLPRYRFGLAALVLAIATGIVPAAVYAEQPLVPPRVESSDESATSAKPSKTAPELADAERIEAVVAAARAYVGTPYRVGTEGPATIDCSGLVFRAFANAGELRLIGGARLRAAGYMRWFAARGLLTGDQEQVERGDLVMYGHGKHIGLYLGEGRVISALVTGVTVHALDGISIPVTGFLAVDWTGKRGPLKPTDVVPPASVEQPEVPAALVPAATWTPLVSEEAAAGPAVAGEEVADMRTAYSRTFSEDDGRFTTEIFSSPIHYLPDGAGAWRSIDLRFRAPERGESFAALAETSPVTLELHATSPRDTLLTARAGEQAVGLRIVDATSNISPEIGDTGAYADYRDPLGAATGLRVLPRADGLKAFLVFAERPTTRSFRFALDARELQPTAEADGSVTLRDAAGAVLGRFTRPMLLDSADVEGDGGAVRPDAATLSVETGEDGSQTLVISVDKAELDEAVYPAYVDLTLVDFPSAAFAAGHTFVSSTHSSGNFSAYQRPESPGYAELWHGRRPDRHDDNEAYLRFPGVGELLRGATVEAATLAAFPYWQDGTDEPSTSWLGRVAEEWDLRTLNWDARPAAVLDTNTYETTQGGWSAIDVSSYVSDVAAGVAPDYGLVLHANGAGRGHWKRLVAESGVSTESLEPRLVVTWSRLRPTVVASTVLSASVVELAWTNAAVAPAASRIDVQISSDGFATISHGVRLAGDDARTGTVSWETAGWASGTYSWRVRAAYGAAGKWGEWSDAGTFVIAASAEPRQQPSLESRNSLIR